MNLARCLLFLVVAMALSPATARSQTAETSTNPPPVMLEETSERKWSFSASLYSYFVPDDREYVQPTFSADRDWLHLEARYNYEDLDTGSVWVGYNLGGGKKLEWEFTPMLGGVFGELTGVAPGYAGSLSWWKLSLYTEGEYVIDTGDHTGNFFYTWSELSLAPVDWFRFGVVAQKTKLYETDRDVQRGLLVGFTYRSLDLTGYVFNLDESQPTWVFAVTFNF